MGAKREGRNRNKAKGEKWRRSEDRARKGLRRAKGASGGNRGRRAGVSGGGGGWVGVHGAGPGQDLSQLCAGTPPLAAAAPQPPRPPSLSPNPHPHVALARRTQPAGRRGADALSTGPDPGWPPRQAAPASPAGQLCCCGGAAAAALQRPRYQCGTAIGKREGSDLLLQVLCAAAPSHSAVCKRPFHQSRHCLDAEHCQSNAEHCQSIFRLKNVLFSSVMWATRCIILFFHFVFVRLSLQIMSILQASQERANVHPLNFVESEIYVSSLIQKMETGMA